LGRALLPAWMPVAGKMRSAKAALASSMG
jgi:hypothetical protein